jgi:crotonobetainyl-CoA:carnitine CoA-transferase CaiB-like acyl-CoA transferase
MEAPLSGDLVVELSTGVPGAYCTKVLADGGAEVIKVEGPSGDPLRRWSASGAAIRPEDDGALFQFLACSKRSVVAEADDLSRVEDLIRTSTAVVWSPGSPLADALPPSALRTLAPQATVVAITPFGLEGPWSGRPVTDATLQAWAGGTGQRGLLERPPLQVGGRLGDWEAGMIAAAAALASRHRTVRTGFGELVDVSMLECQTLTMVMYPVTFFSIAGRPVRPFRMVNLPGIHPTKDGFVGFMVVTGQQWLDFCSMMDKQEWLGDESLLRFDNRARRRAELLEVIDGWMSQRTTDEVIELASLYRIPVAPVANGETLPQYDHMVEGKFFVANPRGDFLQPDVPYTLGGGAGRRPFEPAPRLGEHTAILGSPRAPRPAPTGTPPTTLPFEGLRIADFTSNWAGPIVTHFLALLGAEVIKVESPRRPDALRFNTVKSMNDDQFWEWSPLNHGPNTNKLDLTLDMATERGRELARQLIGRCDVVVENYSPRVLDGWGFGYDDVKAIKPDVILARLPAYGLTGPWRDRVGYAQTIEMTGGLAWLTGFADLAPEIPNGPCDPIAGTHATIALLLALEHKRRTGHGMLVEVPMVGGAINLGAEQIVEWSAYGRLLHRQGNRSPWAAPQGTYLTADLLADGRQDRWVTISVENDRHWRALVAAMGDPAWATGPDLDSMEGRRAAHDLIDAELSAWCQTRSSDEVIDTLWSTGVPVGKNLLPHEHTTIPQLDARRYWQVVTHPVTGDNVHAGYPAQFSNGPAPGTIHRRHPPTLGQDNHDILTRLLGLDDEEIGQLEADGIIGTRVAGTTAW